MPDSINPRTIVRRTGEEPSRPWTARCAGCPFVWHSRTHRIALMIGLSHTHLVA